MDRNRWIHALAVFGVGVATGWLISPGPGDTPPAPSSELAESSPRPSFLASPPQPEFVKNPTGEVFSGNIDAATSDEIAATPNDNVADEETAASAATPEQLASILHNGSDQERINALTHSLEQGIEVPTNILRDTVQSDSSSAVRLLAFRMYVDVMSDDSDDASSALTLGALNDDPDVRAEAQMRLAEFELLQQASVSQDPLQ